MPHQCTNCGRSFPDGSKEMLSGCPDCGGTKFQFRPTGGESPDSPSVGDRPETPPDPADRQWPEHGDEPAHVRASTAEANAEASATDPDADDGDIIEADERPIEGSAQADARSGFAGPFELDRESDADEDVTADDPGLDARTDVDDGFEPAEPEPPSARPGGSSDDDQPGLSDLRRELNDQFESIKIVEPGQYELNLMELYDREEYVISLREDGKYVIEVPETWRGGPDS